MERISNLMPQAEAYDLFLEKMTTSENFSEFISKIGTPKMNELVDDLKVN